MSSLWRREEPSGSLHHYLDQRGRSGPLNNYKSSFDTLREQRLASLNQSSPASAARTPRPGSGIAESRHQVADQPILRAVHSGVEEPPFFASSPLPPPTPRPALETMTRDDLYNECSSLRWSFDNALERRERSEQAKLYYRDLVGKYQSELERLRDENKELHEAWRRAEEETENYKQSCDSLRNQLADLDGELYQARVERDQLTRELRNQSLLNNGQRGPETVVESMKSELRERDEAIFDLSRANEALERELDELRRSLQPQATSPTPPQTSVDPLAQERLQSEVEQLQETVEALRNTLAQTQEAHTAALRSEAEKADRMRHETDLHQDKEKENLIRQKAELQDTVDSLASQLAKRAPISLEDWKAFQQEYDALQKQLKAMEGTHKEREAQGQHSVHSLQDEIQSYQKEVELHQQKEDALIAELQQVQSQLQATEESVDQLRGVITDLKKEHQKFLKDHEQQQERNEEDRHASQQDTTKQVQEIQTQLDTTQKENENLSQTLEKSEAQREDLERRLGELEKRLEEQDKQLDEAKGNAEEVEALRAALDVMATKVREDDVARLEKALEVEQDHNRTLSENGRALELEVVELTSQVASLQAALAAKDAEVGVASQELEESQQNLEKDLAGATAAAERLGEALVESEAQREDLERRLGELEKRLEDQDKQLDEAKGNAEEVEALRAALDVMATKVREDDVARLEKALEVEQDHNRTLSENGRALELEVVELTSQVASLQAALAAKDAEVGVASQELEESQQNLEKDLAGATAAAERLGEALVESEAQREDLERRLGELEKRLEDQDKQLDEAKGNAEEVEALRAALDVMATKVREDDVARLEKALEVEQDHNRTLSENGRALELEVVELTSQVASLQAALAAKDAEVGVASQELEESQQNLEKDLAGATAAAERLGEALVESEAQREDLERRLGELEKRLEDQDKQLDEAKGNAEEVEALRAALDVMATKVREDDVARLEKALEVEQDHNRTLSENGRALELEVVELTSQVASLQAALAAKDAEVGVASQELEESQQNLEKDLAGATAAAERLGEALVESEAQREDLERRLGELEKRLEEQDKQLDEAKGNAEEVEALRAALDVMATKVREDDVARLEKALEVEQDHNRTLSENGRALELEVVELTSQVASLQAALAAKDAEVGVASQELEESQQNLEKDLAGATAAAERLGEALVESEAQREDLERRLGELEKRLEDQDKQLDEAKGNAEEVEALRAALDVMATKVREDDVARLEKLLKVSSDNLKAAEKKLADLAKEKDLEKTNLLESHQSELEKRDESIQSLKLYGEELLEKNESLSDLLEKRSRECNEHLANALALREVLEEECLKNATLQNDVVNKEAEVASLKEQLESTVALYEEKLLEVEELTESSDSWRKATGDRLQDLLHLIAEFVTGVAGFVEALGCCVQAGDAKSSSGRSLKKVEESVERVGDTLARVNSLLDAENETSDSVITVETFSLHTASSLALYKKYLGEVDELQVRVTHLAAAVDILAERGYDMSEAWKKIEQEIQIETEANKRNQEHRDLLLFELDSANKARERVEEARREADERATLLESEVQVLRLQQQDARSVSPGEVERLRSRNAQLVADYEIAMDRLRVLERAEGHRGEDLYHQLVESEARCQTLQREIDLYKDRDAERRSVLEKSTALAKYEGMRYSHNLHQNLNRMQDLRASFDPSAPPKTPLVDPTEEAIRRNKELEHEQIELQARYSRAEERLTVLEEENRRLARLSGVAERLSTSLQGSRFSADSMPPPSTPSFIHVPLSPAPTPGPFNIPSPLPQQPLFQAMQEADHSEDDELSEEEGTPRPSRTRSVSKSPKPTKGKKRSRSASSRK